MPVDEQAAKTATNALQAIPFGALIGGPLDACISAQAQAARTSWEFIQNVGLTTDPNTGESKAINVTFQYQKNGQMVNLVVPLLTIVPIPYLSIDTVTIDFMASISAAASSVQEDTSSEEIGGELSARGSIGWGPFSLSAEFKANYSSKKDSKSTQESRYSVEYTMNVHVGAGQSDMPAGLATILNILQSSATDAPIGGGLSFSPKSSTLLTSTGSSMYVEATAKNSQNLLQDDAEIVFTLSNVPTGLTLKTTVTRGDIVTEGADSATGQADDQGVVGFTVTVENVDENTYAGPTTMTVTGSATVQNPDPKDPNKTVAAQVDASGKMTTTQFILPPPAPTANTITASPSPMTGVDTGTQLKATFNDSEGKPVDGAIVNFTSEDETI
ncbi:MAG: DUF2589 domain-containing protein, partial [Chlorobiales bacterium]|nr:DUF2589 domain-containing protein [Chlorobiales bacterium]